MINTIILGANGQLGQELSIRLSDTNNLLTLTKKDCDIKDVISIEKKIKSFKPDFLINAAAYTDVDNSENFFELANEVNHKAVKNLAILANKYKFTLIHFSTDYIFNSKDKIPISEEYPKSPINKYGYSKLLGEEAIINTTKRFIILRVSWVYGKYGNNFPKKIINLAKENKTIDVVYDQIGSPTSTSLISYVVEKLIDKYRNNNYEDNIFHLSPNGSCSWYDVSRHILKYIKKSTSNSNLFKLKEINPVRSSSFSTIAKRPKYSYLDNSKIKNFLEIEIEDWDVYLSNFLSKEIE